ncbi:MAG: metallophosphoesterase [Deltaproteobacteria bacterium CG2_30_63_29]|nr:MAG: metallophosphoesterase [Deltaproteobacteria bacterium CG2_30_63_29]PJB39628.1 MAG: metallophosphoesterase [Deltaproteobacteria bacterium CG_4_9_14_3_um_filter_63_12]
MRLVLISDTHGYHEDLALPDGDVLIHAGDLSSMGQPEEIARFGEWLGRQPHRHKVVVAGNHDWGFQREPQRARELLGDCHYLLDSACAIEGFHFWGAPWQPWFLSWAFNLQRGPELAAKWALIPRNTDVLVTHGPPFGILDRTHSHQDAGCADLLARVQVVKPRLHVFGHIHEARGTIQVGETIFVNASCWDEGAEAIVVELAGR